MIKFLYKTFVKPVLFLFDPEFIHDAFTVIGKLLGSNFITRGFTALAFRYKNQALNQKILGIKFENPVGLAAGFDKDAHMTKIMPPVGFGFEEIGAITGEPCKGNPKPRLWRHPEIEGLRVHYGLKNRGAEFLVKKLKKRRFRIPIGINIAKTNNPVTCDTDEAIEDYIKVYKHFKSIGDYMTINISCPNTYGGEPFTDKKRLNKLLTAFNKMRNKRPLFIKLSPDLSPNQIDEIAETAKRHKIEGLICSNLSKKHKFGKGGLSGRSMAEKPLQQIRHLRNKYGNTFVLIACGGIFSGEDAYRSIKAGASLVQLITGMIYEGPQLIGEINRDLVKLLKKDGFENIQEAIGSET